MLACITLVRTPSRLVVPDDFTLETWPIGIKTGSKNLVEDDFGVVGRPPVQVNIEAAILGQHAV